MKSILSMIVVGSLVALSACKDEEKTTGVSVETYNELVKKHNELAVSGNQMKTASWEASNAFVDYFRATESMDSVLKVFSDGVLRYVELSDAGKVAQYPTLRRQFESGNAQILRVRNLLIEQYNELYELAPQIYEKKTEYLDS